MRKIYGLLTLVGIILPFSQFLLWLTEYGFNVSLFIDQIIANPLATFAWLDVIVTVIVIVVMVMNEGKNDKIKRLWIPIIASFVGGASVGLPLFLYMKQCHLEKNGLVRN